MYDNYCYQVHGEFEECPPDTGDWSDGECRASWDNALSKCLDLDGNLVSVRDKYENGGYIFYYANCDAVIYDCLFHQCS